jgi:hypothetical protein
MITLTQPADYALLLVIAAVSGLVGGLGYELVQTRGNSSGSIELMRRNGDFVDLGVAASLILGGIAAVAVLYVLPPQVTVSLTAADGQTTTTTQYDIIKLVSLSLVAGASGGALITALRNRVTAAVATQRTETTKVAGKTKLDTLNAEASRAIQEALALGGAQTNTPATVPSGPMEASAGRAASDPDSALRTFEEITSRLDAKTSELKAEIDAVAGGPSAG